MRKASCACGQLSISLTGDPQHVLVCHCRECQKATGAPFGASTYWRKSSVSEIRGASTSYTRMGDNGKALTNHFCPHCGGRVYWYAEFYPDGLGVAYGAFDAADLPPPTEEYWTKRRHPWVGFKEGMVSHPEND